MPTKSLKSTKQQRNDKEGKLERQPLDPRTPFLTDARKARQPPVQHGPWNARQPGKGRATEGRGLSPRPPGRTSQRRAGPREKGEAPAPVSGTRGPPWSPHEMGTPCMGGTTYPPTDCTAVLSAMGGLTAEFGMGSGDPPLHGPAHAGRWPVHAHFLLGCQVRAAHPQGRMA